MHKTVNVLDKMPKSLRSKAKAALKEIYTAESRVEAVKALESFIERFGAKYPKAAECLLKDREELLTFYDFPAEHWVHIRTTNPIESTFATVRHRSRKTRNSGSRETTLAMVFQLLQSAENHWQRIKGWQLIPDVINGITFKDGIRVSDQSDRTAA